MPYRNRVDPWGDLHAVPDRGLLTGNRGCLVDASGRTVRHHANRAWITCRLKFRGWRQPLDAPNRWTPLFFLDDAVALAAGHRPCATCRRGDYVDYRDAVGRAVGADRPLRAAELDARLAAERLAAGRAVAGRVAAGRPRHRRGMELARDRVLTEAAWSSLPDGVIVVVSGRPALVRAGQVHRFGFGGWGEPVPGGEVGRSSSGHGVVLTPVTSVLALRHGFTLVLSAPAGGWMGGVSRGRPDALSGDPVRGYVAPSRSSWTPRAQRRRAARGQP